MAKIIDGKIPWNFNNGKKSGKPWCDAINTKVDGIRVKHVGNSTTSLRTGRRKVVTGVMQSRTVSLIKRSNFSNYAFTHSGTTSKLFKLFESQTSSCTIAQNGNSAVLSAFQNYHIV